MKIILLFSPKGGVGKSTTSILLANTLAYHFGKSVVLCSTDRQGTPPKLRSNDIKASGESDGHYEIMGTNEQFFYENILPDRKNLEKDGIDYLLVDSPGFMNEYTYLSALDCDLVLVPVQLSRIDLEEFFDDIVPLITEKLFQENKTLKNKVYWYGSMMQKGTSAYYDFMDNYKNWEKQFGVKVFLPGLLKREGLKYMDTISFPDEEDKSSQSTREVMIEFTEAVLNTLK